jgi:glycosyltransferase involved in cell wall biosynthesis
MFTTLVEEFVNHGHEVTVLAPGKDKTGIYWEKDIPILRVRTLPIKNVPNLLKGVSNILLPYQFERALDKYCKEKPFDLIISPTPPITLVSLVAKLKRKFGSKFYLILRDIFPQGAVDLGFIRKGGAIHRYFRKKEDKLYKVADYIGCMSQGNIDFLLRHNPGINIEKLHELKNFQKNYQNYVSNADFIKKKYRIVDRFVVVFGGNMGKPQQLENVLTLATSVIELPDILFLLLGEGVEMNKIEVEAKRRGLNNIKFQSTIPKQEYQDLLSVCDIGLISLHANFTVPNIPSKALDYFNVSIPILASIDRFTDFGLILDEEKCGLWSFAGDHKLFKENLLKFYFNRSLRKEFGNNGRIYFMKHLTPNKAYITIINNVT